MASLRLQAIAALLALVAFAGVSHGFEFHEATVEAIHLGFGNGSLTSTALVRFYLDQISHLNPLAVIEVNPDALEQAERADAERASSGGRLIGGVHDVPVLLKDNIATSDKLNTTAGSYALLGSVARRDAGVVTRLRWAGAVVLGKANPSEWSNFSVVDAGWSARGGQTLNPYVLSSTPCGSSAGPGVAAAANMAAVTLGTETDGSILCPSSLNSVVGIKRPTLGLTSRSGVIPITPLQDTVGFFVAALSSAFRRGHYKLDLFDSNTGSWSTKPMYVESSQKQNYSFSCPTKVIAIGGSRGSIAWVDLCQGLLICDLLMDDDALRYIRLPFLMAHNKMHRGASCDRDIAMSNGTIKYFEMCVHAQPGSLVDTTYISQDWEAAAWKWVDSEKNWHMEYKLKASEVLVDKSCYQLLPELNHDEDMKTTPVLSRLHTGHPALSLHDDYIVYIMAKVDHRDQKAWMLAVDMRNNTVKGVADFNAERTSSFRLTYLQSNISKYVAK